MRNISVIQDQLLELDLGACDSIVSIAVNHTHHRFYALSKNGLLATYDISDHIRLVSKTQLLFDDTQETWFALDFLIIGSTVVAISREGSIVTADDNGENELENIDQIGVIDGGIRASAWSPDFSSLAIVTGNNTLLLMSNTWEPISEVDLLAINPLADVSLSWKGDGELFSLVSQDAADKVYYARVYNKSLQLQATGRNVADGPASMLKGVGGCVSFAPNGTLVAIYQRKAAELPQVAFIEKNGLRHGDFDLRKPPVPSHLTLGEWDVKHLCWDMTSTVIAVSWSAQIISSSTESATWGCVQLYYRENYYWYLKQQWHGLDMRFLAFDDEVHGRLYVTQSTPSTATNTTASTVPALRIIDTFWKISSSQCRDGTVTVTDGDNQHFTPLGYHNVPPPMSMFQEKWSATALKDIENHHIKQSCARSIDFWSMSGSNQQWGAAMLLNEQGLVTFVLGNERGRISRSGFLQIPNPQQAILREIAVVQVKHPETLETKVVLVAVGATAHPLLSGTAPQDMFIVLHIDQDRFTSSQPDDAISFTHQYVIEQVPGAVYAMTRVVGDEHCLAIGVKDHDTANYDVYRLDFASAYADLAQESTLPEHASLAFAAFPQEQLLTIPEVCPQLYVIANTGRTTTATTASYYSHTVISLSLKNRLYVGEVLLAPGASSFVFNRAYNMLMFITVGTKPMLHFVTFGTLLKINPLMGEDQQELFEAAEPRPVERGAKLVASIENDSKIIIQLPRGNLETFEPRPLIILRAQQLLNQRKLADCLILLRLQRIDLNYLVDFDPTIFFEALAQLIPDAILKKADLLSLFITSLEPVDVTTTKYVLFDETSVDNRQRRRQFVDAEKFFGDEKVNITCMRMRTALLQYLGEQQQQQQQSQVQSNSSTTSMAKPTFSTAHYTTCMNAILCTYAKQRPPLLVDALHFIQQQHQLLAHQQNNNSSSYKSLQQNAIKYLVFLVDGTQLFDAAVGDCVFDLARGVARQCQMDPKVYLPLLEKFECIGRGHRKDSLAYQLMHLQVQHHLSRILATVEDFVQLLRLLYETAAVARSEDVAEDDGAATNTAEITVEQVQHAQQLAEEMIRLASTNTTDNSNQYGGNPHHLSFQPLMNKLLPQLVSLETLMEDHFSLTADTDTSTSSGTNSNLLSASIAVTKQFITFARSNYAKHALQSMQYPAAIAAYLACYPPQAQRAVDTAMAAGDWKQALFLCNRFHQPTATTTTNTSTNTSNASGSGSSSSSNVIAPIKLVQDIVSNFKQNQENVDFAVDMDIAAMTVSAKITASHQQPTGSSASFSLFPSTNASSCSSMNNGGEESKAIEAARLCVDYLQDVESAVTILVTAHHWTAAMEYAGRFQRKDLYDEIYLAAREAAEEIITTLEDRRVLFPEAARVLNEFWTSKVSKPASSSTGSGIGIGDKTADAEETVVLDRLHQVAQHDRVLQRILERLELGDDYEDAINNHHNNAGNNNNDGQSVIQDNASDFSAASKYSLLSLRSVRSAQSSSVSVQSTGSRASQYSLASTTESQSSSSSSSAAAANFSIQGLEHSLLSRGTVDASSAATPLNTGANKPKKPVSKGEKRRKRAAEEVEELRREREQALLDPNSSNTSSHLDGEDATRRKHRRHEKQKHRAQEKNKDESGLVGESEKCDCLWQATVSLPYVITTLSEMCRLFAVNHGAQVSDHVLAVRLQAVMEEYVQALQMAIDSLPAAPEYPVPWLQQRNMPHVQFFQDVRLLYEHIVTLRLQQLNLSNNANVAAAARNLGNAPQPIMAVRLEDMAILRRYEHDVWHMLRQGVVQWSATKLLLLHKNV